MKETRNLLLGIVFGILIIGTLAFLCMPAIVQGASFFLGFMASLVVVTLVLTIVFIKRRKLLSATKTQTCIGLLVAALIVLIGSAGSYIIIKQNEQVEAQKRYQQTQVDHQSQLKETMRIKGLMFIMGNLMNKVEEELSQSSERILSDQTISRIADLSHSFLPDAFNYVENDSLSEEKLSQERGQLLLALVRLQIDSNSFEKIMQKTPFSRADLHGADLKGANLNGIDLMSANLKGADLSQAEVMEADLRGVNLWGANLEGADLSKTALNRADLRWAHLNEADLRKADLKGADLANANVKKANLSGADVAFSNLNEAFFNQANFAQVNMFAANLSRANFSGTNLSEVDMRRSNLRETIFNQADLTKVKLDMVQIQEQNWFMQLNTWEVKGVEEIQKTYKIVEGVSGRTNYSLEKIEQ